MKTIKNLVTHIALTVFLSSMTSCIVVHDNGGKKGWFKNSNNPHHPHSTNPGHGRGKSKK